MQSCGWSECIVLREISQRKDKYHTISLMRNLRHETHEHRGMEKERMRERERLRKKHRDS